MPLNTPITNFSESARINSVIHKQDASQIQTLPVCPNNPKVMLDQKGYFLIRINTHEKLIEVGFCNPQHQLLYEWKSASPADLCKAIDEKNLLSNYAHAMYLGREFQRAHECLLQNQEYIQD